MDEESMDYYERQSRRSDRMVGWLWLGWCLFWGAFVAHLVVRAAARVIG